MDDEKDHQPPEPTKLTQSKERWVSEGRYLTGRISRPEEERLPPGQHLVKNWPILDLGVRPTVTGERWEQNVSGGVKNHCVTSWSRYDNQWQGVTTQDLLDRVQPHPDARFVLLYSNDGYTTNLTLEDFAAQGALLAHSWEGNPLSTEHGGPVRLIVPHLYFWKSAKWIRRIQFRVSDVPGYWEERGYHNRGDPWQEERYSDDE